MNHNSTSTRGALHVRLASSAPASSTLRACALAVCVFLPHAFATAQQTMKPQANASASAQPQPMPALVRRTTRREVRRTGYGGSVTLYGAPTGAVTVEAWSRSEIEITAEIELRADTEEELARLAAVNTFTLDHDASALRLFTLGTHDRKYMKRVAGKNFPKKLLNAAWRIDYTVRVPAYTDLEIYAGQGAISVSNVEGALRLSATEGDVSLQLAGGDAIVTHGRGRISLQTAQRSWRGRGVEIRLSSGEIVMEVPAGFNADMDARVLRSGKIENTFGDLTPINVSAETPATSDSPVLHGRLNTGGAIFALTVGDGIIRLKAKQ